MKVVELPALVVRYILNDVEKRVSIGNQRINEIYSNTLNM
jgi:hypothetical protein